MLQHAPRKKCCRWVAGTLGRVTVFDFPSDFVVCLRRLTLLVDFPLSLFDFAVRLCRTTFRVCHLISPFNIPALLIECAVRLSCSAFRPVRPCRSRLCSTSPLALLTLPLDVFRLFPYSFAKEELAAFGLMRDAVHFVRRLGRIV